VDGAARWFQSCPHAFLYNGAGRAGVRRNPMNGLNIMFHLSTACCTVPAS
jgi:hypothetical protein